MRKILACIMTGALFLSSGCAAIAQPAVAAQSAAREEISQPPQDGSSLVEETFSGGRQAGNNENMQMGKIISVSGDNITIELATIQRPERDMTESGNSRPPRQNEENQGERKRPEDADLAVK